MLLCTLGVSLITIGFASYFSRSPGVSVDLSNGWHVLAFAIGCCWTFISALVRMSIIIAYTSFIWPSFGDSYLNILDVATIWCVLECSSVSVSV
jgi:hypothetical protein